MGSLSPSPPLSLSLSFPGFNQALEKRLAPEPRNVQPQTLTPYCGLLEFYLPKDWASLPHYFSTLLLVTKFVALDTSFHGAIK